jgi:hypothetical protein
VAVMHSHSKYSDILSGMLREGDVIRITGEQMINAIEDRSTGLVLAYTDTLEIPIIRNDPSEGLFIVRKQFYRIICRNLINLI